MYQEDHLLEAPDFSRVRVHELLNLVEGDSVLATAIIKVAVDSTRDDDKFFVANCHALAFRLYTRHFSKAYSEK